MSSQQYKIEKLVAKRREGKRAIVKVGDAAYEFMGVIWGGVSPRVCLKAPTGDQFWHSAAEWKALGAKL